MSSPVPAVFQPLQLGCIVVALALAGCARDAAPDYSVSRESTLTDAQGKARGRHSQAPSQLQMGFGDNTRKPGQATAIDEPAQSASESAATHTTIRPLREPKTFLGTLPCPKATPNCVASRITLTLAPDGKWRSRAQALDRTGGQPQGQPDLEQGCWVPTGQQPWRIRLHNASNTTRASFTFINDNVLRIDSYNDTRPTLNYHLTRQQDIDGIHELDDSTPINCQNRDEGP